MSAKYLLFFRAILLLTLLLQAVMSPGAEARLTLIFAVFALYAAAAATLFELDRRGKVAAQWVQWSFLIDLAMATGVLYMNPGNSADYHIAFFLVILSSSFLHRPPFSFLLAGVACVVYGSLGLPGDESFYQPQHLMRLALLPVIAFFSTYMADSARRIERRTAERYETQLEWMERLSTIGKALRGILHEVKTPLGTISLTAEFIGEKVRRGEEVNEEIEIIRSEAERATAILRNFLEFTRPTELTLEEIPLKDILTQAVAVMKPQFHDSGIEWDIKLKDKMTVQGSEPHLRQVFANIFTNALKAMPMGGKMVIRQSDDDEYLRITFVDNGTGISTVDLKNIYEPYGDTENTREGYGLGLSMCRWIMHRHDGTIRVTSPGLGKGTSVSLAFPFPNNS